jgi:high-affinity iron transporter
MFSTFIITLREGVEISIILAVILAYLKQLGASRASGKVWLGTVAAALVSLLTGVVIFFILGKTELGDFQEVLEGAFMLLAVVILTWMTIWMKRQSADLSGSLKVKVKEALNHGSGWALASLAFATVIREGIETVLFIAGAGQTSTGGQIWGGTILGFGLAAIIGYVIYRGTHRLPLKSFFNVMSLLLIFMAAGLASNGIHAFQEVSWIPEGFTVWNTQSILSQKSTAGSLLKAIFGYRDNPNIVLVLTYLIYLIPALTAYFKPAKSIESQG